MGEIRKTYSVEFKQKAVQMYLHKGMGYKSVAKELGITHKSVQRWVKYFQEEGIQGLEEKRGKAKGPLKGRPRTREQSVEAELHRLRAENEYLKKLWALQRGEIKGGSKPSK
ncbi:helix-turn-helix domain-containing protein [Paenibacillus sp. VCA1]|uniref:helix-turn-helix domain-containing protein n=1 Tax=Paenibacillus sp. VCA1 TaxID=3039148 RepID=UPI0028716B50|nr:helix-turn-helix domain-containing protein [Paenibacillus sp. VCA1]MDR9858002.1 helix-turn-helix domain-containing protein [Paenibacillus sp. VCA1]